MDISPRGYLESQVSSLVIYRVVSRCRERSHADILGINTHKQVVHTGIAHRSHVNDIPPLDACLNGSPAADFIQTLNDGILHYRGPIFMGHIVGDTRHHIFTVNCLRVHHGLGGYYLARSQVTQVTNYGGGAYVEGYTISLFHLPWLYQDNLFIHPYRYGYLPLLGIFTTDLSHRILHRLQHQIVKVELLRYPILLVKRITYPLKVREGVIKARCRYH